MNKLEKKLGDKMIWKIALLALLLLTNPIQAKEKNPAREQGLSYGISLYGSASDLHLPALPVHQLTYHFHEESRGYGFFGISQAGTMKNGYGIQLTSLENGQTIADNQFSLLFLGVGYKFWKKSNWVASAEFAGQSYMSANEDMRLGGFFLACKLSQERSLWKNIDLLGHLGLRYEQLNSATVSRESGKLENTFSGLSSYAGIEIRYVF